MRLINTTTHRLENFDGKKIPKYAILSHTWCEGQEVTLREFQAQDARGKLGWVKIRKAAELALHDELDYLWVDTCCIDKASSAELSEAINSMMRWYQNSEVCYTYLVDVPSGLGRGQEAAFRRSRWFTRGCTLQELLAPSKLIFLFADWTVFETRDALAGLVSSITGVEERFLHTARAWLDPEPARLDSASIAQRMSWASRRETTRIEDTAYCLLGIFGINMPLLYGEGPKAFIRLQEQILMSSDDQSLLAWNFDGLKIEELEGGGSSWYVRSLYELGFAGLLATSPSAFVTCGNITRVNLGMLTPPSSLTNKGLRLELPLGSSSDTPYAFLQCQEKGAPASVVAVCLKRNSEGIYVRARLPLRLANYRLLLDLRPTVLYALQSGDYKLDDGWEPGLGGYTVIVRNLPKELKIIRTWCRSGNPGPYLRLIIEDDCESHINSWHVAAVLLGDSSTSKPSFVLLAATRMGRYPQGLMLVTCLVKLDGVDESTMDSWERHRLNSLQLENHDRDPTQLLSRLAQSFGEDDLKLSSAIRTATGVYYTSTETQDCFGKKVLCVDINFRFNNFRRLTLDIESCIQKRFEGSRGSQKAMLLILTAPRIGTMVLEYMLLTGLKLGVNPFFQFPFMIFYAIVCTRDPPRLLARLLEPWRSRHGNRISWAKIIVFSFIGCKFVGSDMMAQRFKQLLDEKRGYEQGQLLDGKRSYERGQEGKEDVIITWTSDPP
ncbi:hypothetical protein CEP51_005092 [Fusarium floridanum]|uniref:Uncharacterized protein n=1 Tax=Fusarium floridanum TaxID=1325733 RepID=A0A428RYC0_9HYPO|nr:hypothetical protein CEP51_005092 [Fusarium floridanum]